MCAWYVISPPLLFCPCHSPNSLHAESHIPRVPLLSSFSLLLRDAGSHRKPEDRPDILETLARFASRLPFATMDDAMFFNDYCIVCDRAIIPPKQVETVPVAKKKAAAGAIRVSGFISGGMG